MMEEFENFLGFSAFGGFSAVYLLLKEGKVVYAGKSTQVFARISQHHARLQRHRRGLRQRPNDYSEVVIFDEVKVKFVERSNLDKEELALIQKYLPRYNTFLNRPVSPMEQNIRELPCIQNLIRKAGEREAVLTPTIKRRRLPTQVLRVEEKFQRFRDSNQKVTLPRLKCLEDGPD